MELDRNGLVVLDREECLRLLAGAHLGRLGVSMSALPVVLPVNYAFDGDAIVVRTATGTKFDAALAGAVVAFEVDDIDPMYQTGWSVMVQGLTEVVRDEAALERTQRLPLRAWASPEADQFVRITIERVSGRRIVHDRVPVAAAAQ